MCQKQVFSNLALLWGAGSDSPQKMPPQSLRRLSSFLVTLPVSPPTSQTRLFLALCCGILFPLKSFLQHLVSQPSEAKVLCKDWPWGAFIYRYKLVVFSLQKNCGPKANSYLKLRVHSLLYKQITGKSYSVSHKSKLVDYHFPWTPSFSPLRVFPSIMLQLQRG